MRLDLSFPQPPLQENALQQDLIACNRASAQFGLSLTMADMRDIAVEHAEALRETKRVEFGPGPLQDIVKAFGSSPYLTQESFAETLSALQGVFYRLKEETESDASDEELIDAMRFIFDGQAHGSLDFFDDLPRAVLQQALQHNRQDTNEDWSEHDSHQNEEKDTDNLLLSVSDETTRIHERDHLERPTNEYAAGFYDEAFELYRQRFDYNSRIGGSSL